MALSTEFLPYIFGGSTGETAESIAKKRQVAEALLARSGAPRNVGEGLTAVGNALASVILERRAAAAEKEGQAGASDAYSDLVKLLGGDEGGGDIIGGVSGAPSPAPAAPVIARPPSAGTVENIPAGWGAGGSFAPPTGPAGAPVAKPMAFSGGKQGFIDMLMPAAVELGKKIGLDPRLIVAQAAQETGYGAHAPGGNYFGIKSHGMPGGQSLRTTEYAGGVPHAENASFRTYSGPEASVRGYGDFLQSNPRYGPMLKAQGLDAQLAELGRSGYATDPNYAGSVGNIARGIPMQGTQVASLDPGVGLPPPPTAVQRVAAAMPGAPPAGPEMASAAPPVPPFVPPSVPTGIMPTRGVQSVAGALAPPAPPQAAAPVQRPQQASPAVSQQEVQQAALKVLGNSFSNAGQRAYAQEILKRAMQQQDPTYQLGLEKQRLEVEAARNKAPETKEIGGVLYQYGPDGWKPVTPAVGPEWRDATPAEIAAMRLPPNTPLQVNTKTGEKRAPTGLGGAAGEETFFGNLVPYQEPAKWAPGGKSAVEGSIGFGQVGNRGGFKPVALPPGARPAPTTRDIKTDTEVITVDLYGNELRRRPLNVEEAARQRAAGTAVGTLQGTAFAGLEPAIIASNDTIKQIDALIANPGLGGITGGPLGLALNQFKPTFQMTSDENRAYTQFEQLQGRAFLEARTMLKGGGQITDYEGARAERAMTRMSRALSKEDFIDAINEFKDAVKTGVEKIRAAAKTTPSARTPTPSPAPGAPAPAVPLPAGGGPVAAPQSPPLEGIRAVNPTTGEKLILKNGQWVPDNG